MLTTQISQIEFEITSLCNAACPGCPRTQLGPGTGFQLNTISFDNLKSWFPQPHELEKLNQFKFSGNLGDPAVHPNLYEIVEWLGKNYFKRISIHSNGGIRDAAWWAKMGSLSREGYELPGQDNKWRMRVNWAIDGLKDTNYIYRVGVRWDHLWRNLNSYLDAGGRAEWHFIAFQHNEHQIDEARELATKLGMEFRLRYAARNERTKWVNKTGEEILPGEKSKHPFRKEIKETEQTFQKSIEKKDVTILSNIASDMNCIHLNDKTVFISADQKLWPCCMLYDETLKQGEWARAYHTTLPESGWNDLRLHTMQEILNHAFYHTLIDRWDTANKTFTQRCVRSCGSGGKFLTKML